MMAYISRGSSLQIKGGLPVVTESDFERYSKSKLVIKDQWASHPATEDRIAALNKLNIRKSEEDYTPANQLFRDVKELQESLTHGMYTHITFPGQVMVETDADFEKHYADEYPQYVYPALFNGYFDRWNPTPGLSGNSAGDADPASLFNDEMSGLAASLQILEGDKATLHQLTIVDHSIKTFDYDGEKYNMDNIYSLKERLDDIIAGNKRQLEENDAKAFAFFRALANGCGELEAWEKKYADYSNAQQQQDEQLEVFNTLVKALAFMHEQHSYENIQQYLVALATPERKFRELLDAILNGDLWQRGIRTVQREIFTKYLASEQKYLTEKGYDNNAVELLYATLRNFPAALAMARDSAKLALLEASAELVKEPAGV